MKPKPPSPAFSKWGLRVVLLWLWLCLAGFVYFRLIISKTFQHWLH